MTTYRHLTAEDLDEAVPTFSPAEAHEARLAEARAARNAQDHLIYGTCYDCLTREARNDPDYDPWEI